MAYKLDKLKMSWMRITAVDGNRINSLIGCGTPTADVLIIKILWYSTLSAHGAKLFTMDFSNLYLDTPMKGPVYTKKSPSIMPQEIIERYNLLDIAKDGWIYMYNYQWPKPNTSQRSRVPPIPAHTWTLQAGMASHHLHPHSWRLWCQIKLLRSILISQLIGVTANTSAYPSTGTTKIACLAQVFLELST